MNAQARLTGDAVKDALYFCVVCQVRTVARCGPAVARLHRPAISPLVLQQWSTPGLLGELPRTLGRSMEVCGAYIPYFY